MSNQIDVHVIFLRWGINILVGGKIFCLAIVHSKCLIGIQMEMIKRQTTGWRSSEFNGEVRAGNINVPVISI